jgi:hypothetical protein
MSVPKGKRSKSRDEFEMIFFQLVDAVDNLVEHQFFADGLLAEKNKVFMEIRCRTLEDLTDKPLYHIKIANSIYPKCMAEWEERRVSMGKAIGCCYAILTNLQRITVRLRVPDTKYVVYIKTVDRMINSLRAWRQSDWKLKGKLEAAQNK